MKFVAPLAGMVVVLFAFALPAGADEDNRLFRRGVSATLEPLALLGQTSSACEVGSSCGSVTLEFGALGILRVEPFELGFVVQGGGEVWGTQHLRVGATGGLAVDPLSWFRLEALADIGVHSMSDIGWDLFTTSSPDEDEAFPYVGLRLGWTARFGSGPVRPLVGMWGSLQTDLGRRTVVLQEETCLLGCSSAATEWELGGLTGSVSVRAGIELR